MRWKHRVGSVGPFSSALQRSHCDYLSYRAVLVTSDMTERKLPPLAYGLLSLLARRPRSGYDLAAFLKPPITLLWPVAHSQIYPLLHRLEERGYLIAEAVAQADKPDKKIYTPTEGGLSALRAWVLERAMPHTARNPMRIRIHASWLVKPREVLAMLEHEATACAEEIREMEVRLIKYRQDHDVPGDVPTGTPEFATIALYELARRVRDAQIGWCRWVLQSLSRGVAAPGAIEAGNMNAEDVSA